MKTSARTRVLGIIILLLLSWTNVLGQDELGPNRLLDALAPTLSGPEHIRIRLRSRRFVGRVGGVAFGATAVPAGPFSFKSLSLSYRPEKRDGNRLWVTVDGREFVVPIYDWQLVPIAKFADSPYKACFTLFGRLYSPQEEKSWLEDANRGNRILNYHPAFINTLLGLRIFQLDILIGDPAATDLPTQKGTYILGEGEARPDKRANLRAWDAVFGLRHKLDAESPVKSNSYVITDEGRDVYFSLDGGGLNIIGEPYIYFWRYKSEFPGYDMTATRQRIIRETTKEAEQSLPKARRRRAAAQKDAYIRMFLRQLLEDIENDGEPPHASDEKILRLKSYEARRDYLRNYPTKSVRDVLIDRRVRADAFEVIPLTAYSEGMSRESATIRRINPAVWDAGANVMRYAAFFRYYKAHYSSQWEAFLSRISQVKVSPEVKTPSRLQRAS